MFTVRVIIITKGLNETTLANNTVRGTIVLIKLRHKSDFGLNYREQCLVNYTLEIEIFALPNQGVFATE